MGVTQTNAIDKISGVNNFIPVNLSTDNFIITPGETSWLDILVNSKDNAENLTFQLDFNGNSLVFTSKTTPDNIGLQFPAGAAYASITLWIDAIITYLNKNELLSDNFRIWKNGNHLILESKIKSASKTISFLTSDFDWSVAASNAGVDEVLEDNYSIVLSVHVHTGTGLDYNGDPYTKYEKIKTYEIAPLSDGTARLYIQEALKPYLRNTNPLSFSELGSYRNTGVLLKYYIRYSDKYGIPATQKSTIESDIYYALDGGITRKDYSNTSINSILSGASAKFLTWHPTTKWITKKQYDYLYFIQNFNAVDYLYFRFVGTKLNGTTATVDVGTFMGNDKYYVHMIDVRYDYVKSLFGEDLLSFTVQMVDKTPTLKLLSEKRTFNIIQNTPLDAKYYLFKNSFGVYESICFTGKKTKGLKMDKLKTDKILQFSDNKTINEVVYGDRSFQITADIYTGFKTQAELDAFIDFCHGRDYLEQTATYFKPVDLDMNSITLYTDDDNVSSAKIKMIDNTEKNYSNA